MAVLCSMTVYGLVSLWWIVLSSITQGVLSATPLIFIIPSACFLKLSPGRWFQGENLIPSMLILTGMFVMISGLIMTGLYPQDCSHGREMFYCAASNVSGTVPPAWLKHSSSINAIFCTDVVRKTVISKCIMCKLFSFSLFCFIFILLNLSLQVRYTHFFKHYASSLTGRVLCCTFTWLSPHHGSLTATVKNSNKFWRRLMLFI